MPSSTLSPYKQIPETKEDLDWAELVTLDLSLWDKPGGKEKLAAQLEHASQHVGFFYVTNFGISQEEVDRQFALGREFYKLPLDEKLKFYSQEDLDNGELGEGIVDNIEVYNIPKFDGFHAKAHKQPAVLKEHLDEIEKFSRASLYPLNKTTIRLMQGQDIHEKVVLKLLRVLATVLELPEDQLLQDHAYNDNGEDHLRYMHYAARSAEKNKKIGGLYSPGHTDLGTITILFRQPVAGLQILNNKEEWKWAKPMDGTITVNICGALSALTGGYFKSSVHRVHVPPQDQAHIDRLGVLPNNHVYLHPITNSPVLQRTEKTSNPFTTLGKRMTVEEWVKVRQTQQQRRKVPVKITEDGKYTYHKKDIEILPGLTAMVYN
ncbi:hypothetical protein HYALB_00006934 [Hymenoscyphus albidus]|uniref:Clavaminate synthase-like protein n=1 Tax=Hymenoscyphus albidus TaxID=595503 RepID=A0A9N9Q173_9HELO|nr:hypothetical protein HYALB_00006934 [Hymenoscyphus albidus]